MKIISIVEIVLVSIRLFLFLDMIFGRKFLCINIVINGEVIFIGM